MGGLKRVSQRRNDALAQTGWQQVESLLAEHYREQGYVVEHCGTGRTGERFDGGIDLKLRRADEYVLVQVKHWNACKVPHNDVHQLLGLMVNEGATGAILVTSGEFTKAAIEAGARQGHVALIDGDELRSMLGPLPNVLASSGQAARAPAGRDSASGELLTTVVDRLASAAEDRIRHGGGRGRRRGNRDTGELVAKLMGAVLALAIGWYAIDRMTNALRVPRPMAPVANSSAPVRATPKVAESASQTVSSDPCIEVIDHHSGTIIDHCAPERRVRQPTAAEVREQQRRADEAIKVLEATTPEM